MSSKLDIEGIFQRDADDLVKFREKAIAIHNSKDISAAGNEVEQTVRDYFSHMLPSKYEINQGHLIDCNSITSPQLDIIISDNTNIPSLFITKDGTRFVPIDSVYCIGEVKSSYDKSKKYITQFSATIKDIKDNLYHVDRINTCFNGELTNETDMGDFRFANYNKVLNKLLFFMIFINGDNFTLSDISSLLRDTESKYLPNIIVFLNKGIVIKGKRNENGFGFIRYPDEPKSEDEDWYFYPLFKENGQISEGKHLAMLYYFVMEHLSKSFLEPPSFMSYIRYLLVGRKNTMTKLKDVT